MDATYATVSQCLEAFNFERVHTMMVAVDWKWSVALGEDGYHVPTVEEIKSLAERLLYEAVSRRDTISSGGLEAKYFNRHERATLALRFVAAEIYRDYGATPTT